MTTVIFSAKDGRYEVSAYGHSGYAEAGKDIVCAAVSSILGMAAQTACNLERDGIVCGSEYTAGDGTFGLVFFGGGVARALFAAIWQTLSQLERQYPKNVEVDSAQIENGF